MTLASLAPDLFARKGEAAPTPFAGCEAQAAAFARRRRLGLIAPQAPMAVGGGSQRRRREWRRRLTFRLEPALHARLVAAAAKAGLSRQRYLERALAASLRRAERDGAS